MGATSPTAIRDMGMKVSGRLAVLLLVTALAVLSVVLRENLQIALGYGAKQLCSGVFVAALPESFVLERDILPRLAILGPARSSLEFSVDRQAGIAEAKFLGATARAVHTRSGGCSLHSEASGSPPLAPVPVPVAKAVSGIPATLRPAYDKAFAEPSGGGRNTLALLVSRGGERIAERYAEPVTGGTRLQGWSMNKSLMATWVGMQAARGALDPQLSVREALADEAAAEGIDPRLNLLHLLQMESGLDFAEVYGPGSDVTNMLYREPAMWTVPAAVGQAVAPGERFAYSSGDTVLASKVWQGSLDKPYAQWIREQFSEPLGLRSLVAEADASGVQVGSSYANLTGRDWLAVGQLWLDAWHDRSILLGHEWLRASVMPRDSDPRGQYGRGFWLNTGGVNFPGLPDSLFFASGNAGQSVIVVPQWELVVVRLGLTEADTASGLHDFLLALVPALELEQ
jgi:CubicO group peptidase (beta-lactamase class C family)